MMRITLPRLHADYDTPGLVRLKHYGAIQKAADPNRRCSRQAITHL
jgi:hypothetical protein